MNLATREVEGTDVAIYYDFETNIGDFSISLVSTFTDTFYQTPTGEFSALAEAVSSGELPAYASPIGFGDINGTDVGAVEQKDRLQVSYKKGEYRASLSVLRIGELADSGETSAGFMYLIPSMTTADLSISKNVELGGNKGRVKFVVKNIADEIKARGQEYHAKQLILKAVPLTEQLSVQLNISLEHEIFYS